MFVVWKGLAIKDVRVNKNRAVVIFTNGVSHVYIFRVEPHIPHVGSWIHTVGEVVRLDNDIVRNSRYKRSVLAHEITEDIVVHMLPQEIKGRHRNDVAHSIAQRLEREYHIRKWGEKSWHNYTALVDKVWDKENLSMMKKVKARQPK